MMRHAIFVQSPEYNGTIVNVMTLDTMVASGDRNRLHFLACQNY